MYANVFKCTAIGCNTYYYYVHHNCAPVARSFGYLAQANTNWAGERSEGLWPVSSGGQDGQQLGETGRRNCRRNCRSQIGQIQIFGSRHLPSYPSRISPTLSAGLQSFARSWSFAISQGVMLWLWPLTRVAARLMAICLSHKAGLCKLW